MPLGFAGIGCLYLPGAGKGVCRADIFGNNPLSPLKKTGRGDQTEGAGGFNPVR